MNKPEMYVEAFLESEHGYRLRLFDRDAVNAVTFEMQEFDEATRSWKPQKGGGEIVIGFDEVDAVCAAMKAVRDNAPKGP